MLFSHTLKELLVAESMTITRKSFDDRSEPDADGLYDYIYVGVDYTFGDKEDQLTFRLYRDEPKVANLVKPINWSPNTYSSVLFDQAVAHLRSQEAVEIIQVSDPTPPGRGFIPLEKAIQLAHAAGLPVPPHINI